MKRTSFALLVALALVGTACRREPVATALTDTAGVSATRVEGGIRVTNHSERGVAYSIANPNWLGLLAICNDPEPACVRLAAGASVLVPLSEIHGYGSGVTTVTLYWWHVIPDGSGQYKATDPEQVTVTM